MHLLETATGILSANKDVLFHKYPIKELGIFGSVARMEENADSDIDILVEFSEPVGWEIIDLASELEELLGYKVDLVSKKAVRPNLMPFVLKDIVYV
ncbi:nucleotidyltransferase family protein [Haliscomenobacter hydrossis]|uniref:DNA polymerase beta domain protein region n=1 Tax=Haliscomenobacter hydrossis (strain ATCC 27775 / DSM 1100 / LMG 10767 / O) TaxID=760192 RepID=F4KRZ6_HALH1|nr:nucleotidyltransferase [Haliscomenobacter hydrossis]AEE51083.1 DNA polymerase beta domain protein region [Haliscomenobacter hydrossis DSM 1100]